MTTFSHSGLKNAGAQTDAPGSGDPGIQAAREYDAFGSPTASSGTWQGPFGYAGQFGYQGSAPADPLGALHLLGHRYNDPTLGRFLTRDPVGDGSNWYAYCGNSPVNTVDPTGLRWVYEQDDGGLYYDPPIGFVVPNLPAPSPYYVGDGFSGKRGKWRDNPDYEYKKDHGSIPRGTYWIRPPRDFKSDGVTRLPFNLPLHPDPSTEMRGRSDFLIHDGNEAGDPSQGCVILPRAIRERIWGSGD